MPKRRGPPAPDRQLVRFARVLKRARKRAGLSQEALGRLARLSKAEISLLEAAGREPGLLTVIYLARALHMTPSELVRELR